MCTPTSRITTVGTAGTLTLPEGPATGPAGTTTLRTESWLRLHRIA
ncbi:hypothetical protein [Streptomyces sp. NPDC051776]